MKSDDIRKRIDKHPAYRKHSIIKLKGVLDLTEAQKIKMNMWTRQYMILLREMCACDNKVIEQCDNVLSRAFFQKYVSSFMTRTKLIECGDDKIIPAEVFEITPPHGLVREAIEEAMKMSRYSYETRFNYSHCQKLSDTNSIYVDHFNTPSDRMNILPNGNIKIDSMKSIDISCWKYDNSFGSLTLKYGKEFRDMFQDVTITRVKDKLDDDLNIEPSWIYTIEINIDTRSVSFRSSPKNMVYLRKYQEQLISDYEKEKEKRHNAKK